MKQVKKRMLVILFFAFSLLLTSCKESVKEIEEKIDQTAEEIMKTLIDEDEEALFTFFASDMKDNRESETMSEIQKAFDFIDGKIVSYDYHRGGGERSQNYGNIDYYYRRLRFMDVTTDTDNLYTIYVDYIYIWDGKPEREGICQIEIQKNDDGDDEILIGKIYYDDEKYY